MRTSEVTVVRVYLTEGEGQLSRLMELLKSKEEVRGVTVFRGIAGFGSSRDVHTASILDVSLDLPLVLEMFDESGKMQRVMKHLSQIIKPGHMLSWSARTNIDGSSEKIC